MKVATADSLNHPAISDPSAMRDYPCARDAERAALLDLIQWRPGLRVADIQAAGGYLSDGIYDLLNGEVECLCIEPVEELARRLNPDFTWVPDRVDRFTSIPSETVDVVIGLAGLHHSPSHFDTLYEAFRILKPGGQFAVCDVMEDSLVARWLNEYVHHHNPEGHDGVFLRPGGLSTLMARAGFADIQEDVRQVPWRFPTDTDMAIFFKGLFGLKPSVEQIREDARRYLHCHETDGVFQVDWELIYGRGRRLG